MSEQTQAERPGPDAGAPGVTGGRWGVEPASRQPDYYRRYIVPNGASYSAVRGLRVAIVMGASDKEADANAALVAAAPRIFESLQECRWALRTIRRNLSEPADETQQRAVDALDRCIAEATEAIASASPMTAAAMDTVRRRASANRGCLMSEQTWQPGEPGGD